MAQDSELMMGQDDVVIKPFVFKCEECEEAPATRQVLLDLRAAGMTKHIAYCCYPCGNDLAANIRKGLPRK